jgi:hypothetical protein
MSTASNNILIGRAGATWQNPCCRERRLLAAPRRQLAE